MERIRDVSDLVHAVDGLHDRFRWNPLWWRGQERDWPLIAPVHRFKDRGRYEQGITERFKARAGPRHPHCPARGDTAAWLNLMQHYGLPTRLLDWSESPLVGVYFVIRDNKDDGDDGVLWVLDPTRMNELGVQCSGTLNYDAPSARLLLDINAPPPSPGQDRLALTPAQSGPRSIAQLSSFTIHATSTPLDQSSDCAEYLERIVIEADRKRVIRRQLRYLGITESYLFPDLDHLAKQEREGCFCQVTPCPHR